MPEEIKSIPVLLVLSVTDIVQIVRTSDERWKHISNSHV